LVTALLPVLQPVIADFRYDLAGEDSYRVQSTSTVSRVSYSGTERLSVRREGKSVRFEAQAHYVRNAVDGRSDGGARYVAEMLPGGSFEDRIDEDPDFLTILNQPFAVQLDATTLRDLRDMHGSVPFSAASPLGGDSLLRGFLRPGNSGAVDGRPTIAVRFEAAGPMAGNLPGKTDAAISGSMRMDGTAYYSLDSALLLALHATLTIDARLTQGHPSVSIPVRITYRRSIRIATGERALDQAVKTPR
jgi:hypothetical protein